MPRATPQKILKNCVLSNADEDKFIFLVLLKPLRLGDAETSIVALGLTQLHI